MFTPHVYNDQRSSFLLNGCGNLPSLLRTYSTEETALREEIAKKVLRKNCKCYVMLSQKGADSYGQLGGIDVTNAKET